MRKPNKSVTEILQDEGDLLVPRRSPILWRHVFGILAAVLVIYALLVAALVFING